jgi:nucleotide-binding universal stress UspA family protein/quercetin dioxygenase-like cupin family protein
MRSVQTILHPTDFSDNSRSAFQTACSLAKDHKAGLILFHVVSANGAKAPENAPNPLESVESQPGLKDWQLAWPTPPDASLRVEHRLAVGNPANEILSLARAQNCDVIVMGTHGRTGLDRLLTGSVAEEVLRKADCPVMVVRTPSSEPPTPEVRTAVKPGDIVEVRPLGDALASATSKLLAAADEMEIIRLVVPAGKEVTEHKTRGRVIVHCLEGRVKFTALGKTKNFAAGELLYLRRGETYTVQGVEDASLLVTVLLPRHSEPAWLSRAGGGGPSP